MDKDNVQEIERLHRLLEQNASLVEQVSQVIPPPSSKFPSGAGQLRPGGAEPAGDGGLQQSLLD